MTEFVTIDRRDAVLHLQFNRAEKKNALTHAMYEILADSLAKAEEDLSVGAIVFSGAGDCFTSGNDLIDFQQNPIFDETAPGVQFILALASSTVPLIAAVDGPAVGIGSTMLLHCDHVFAAPSAMLQFPFVNLALPPEAGATYLLSRQLGHARAAELLLGGEPFDAAKAHELGIINTIVPAGDLLETALTRAAFYATKPPAAIRKTKKLMKSDMDQVVAQIKAELQDFMAGLKSPECHEALAAFLQKRKPDFNQFRN